MPLLEISDLEYQPPEEIKQCLALAKSLTSLYFNYIANDRTETYEYNVKIFGETTRAPGIHASEISSCHRRVVYSLLGTEQRPDPESSDVNMMMRFRLGHAVHAMLQNDWHRIAKKYQHILFEDEVRINPQTSKVAADWTIQSSCDGIITILDSENIPKVRIGLEIKTESEKQFAALSKPRDYHLEQTTTYMATLNLPLMWIFYYNKGNSNITGAEPPFLFQFDNGLWDKLQHRFAVMHHMAETRQLPDRMEGMHCKWCPYSYICKPSTLNSNTRPAYGSGMGQIRRK